MTKKEINEYGKKIEKILAECLPDYTVSFSERTMNNDIVEYEISIFKKDSNAGRVTTVDIPTCIKKGISAEDAGKQLCNSFLKHIEAEKDMPEGTVHMQLPAYEEIKGYLYPCLHSKKRNKKYLKGLISFDMLDLTETISMIMNMDTAMEDGYVRMGNIYEDALEYWGVTAEEVKAQAEKNVAKSQSTFMKISEMCQPGVSPQCQYGPAMYVLSNENIVNGSMYLTDTERLKRILKTLGEPFYIIPSSINELILVQCGIARGNSDILRGMVAEVNKTNVPKAEILSDSVYYFDGELKIAE